MDCCTRYCAAEAQFGKNRAKSDLRRYRRRGPTGATRVMVEELRRWSLQDKQLLDVGGGIGIIGAELADYGLAGATLVEASPSYLEVAQREMRGRFASRPTLFFLGDFALIADTIPEADLVTLDRVVCCYPDDTALLQAAASRTRSLLAFTYPRERWFIRAFIAMHNFLMRLLRNSFRAFIHPQQRMRATLEASGLVHAARGTTFMWALDLYRRE